MVNAQEWLNTNIPDNRNQVKNLHIYQQQNQKTEYRHGYNHTYYDNSPVIDTSNQSYTYYNALLEGELDLNEFVNLEQLSIHGIDKNQKQQLTNLKINKCVNLNNLSVNHTTLTELDLSNNFRLATINKDSEINLYVPLVENLRKEREQIQSQVKKLINLVQKESNNSVLKSETQEIIQENLDCQLACEKKELEWLVKVAKNRLDENQQEWLDTLLETQIELLQNSSLFARNQLGKVKKILAKGLAGEEIDTFCRKQGEIVELEKKIAKLQINEQVVQIQQAK